MSQLPGVSHSFAGIYFVCNKACTAVQDPVFVCTESYHGKWHVMFVSCIRARTILPHTKGAQLSLTLSVLVYMPPFYKLAFGSQVHVMHCIGSTFTHTHTKPHNTLAQKMPEAAYGNTKKKRRGKLYFILTHITSVAHVLLHVCYGLLFIT